MSAIRGYFKGYNNKQYIVKVYQDGEDETFTEVELAGGSPFTVSYAVSNTPFEPTRISTATISVVHNEYLEQLFSPYAQGTKVKLIEKDEETNVETCVWFGYMVPKIYNQGYVEEYETIELEAADTVSVLQYLDYETLNDGGCVTFKQIIEFILSKVEINTYYWPHSKQTNDIFITPDILGIFEKNFFSNDTDEAWKLQEVIEEMCRYLGITLIQWKDAWYFIDYTAISQGDDRYYKYINGQKGQDAYLSNTFTMDETLSRGNDADISFEPIFNKVSVKDNFYNVDEFIPNIFDDKYLTNRNGDFYTAKKIEVQTPAKASYVSNIRKTRDDKLTEEETSDNKYHYFMRLYDHKYFESYYEQIPYSEFTPDTMIDPYDLVGRLGATIVDLGVVDESTFVGEYFLGEENGVPVGTVDYANSLDYTRYLCVCPNHEEGSVKKGTTNYKKVVMRTPHMKLPCQITKDSYLIFNFAENHTRYKNRPYINPDWSSAGASGPDRYIEGIGHSAIYQWPQGIALRVVFGNKTWSTHDAKWVELGSKWDTTTPSCCIDSPAKNFWNRNLEIANTVSYQMNIKESGYAIPLEGINQDEDFYIEILCSQPSFWAYKELDMWEGTEFESHNAYVWISDFSIKLCEKGQDIDKLDNDVIYENIIDEDCINDFGEITFRYTTWHPNIKPSYSNVVTWIDGERVMLEKIKEGNLTGNEQTAEENMVERHVLQYNTPTKKITHSLPIDNITPFDRITGLDVKNKQTSFMQMGTEIDFSKSIQRITYIQCK